MSEKSTQTEIGKVKSHQAFADFFPVVYDKLRDLASIKMSHERDGHTLDTTALVHEAFIRLGGDSFTSRSGFYRAAAVAMRRILVDHARTKRAEKRGGKAAHIPLNLDHLAGNQTRSNTISVDDALTKLAEIDPQATELVTLRYFGGLAQSEAAETLGLSLRKADRLWAFAKAWLFREISSTNLA